MLFYCQILLNFQSAQALIQVRSLSLRIVNPYGEKPQREEALNSYKYFLTYQKAYAILNQGEKHELYNI